MAFDYKKEYKEYYLPAKKPTIIEIPEMRFLAVRGSGNPNEEGGEYQRAVGLLYGMAWTLKMSNKGEHKIDGFFDYVVPPLEGFWWQENIAGIDYFKKDKFQWISIIRLPDFVTEEDFLWAKKVATEKKKMDFSDVEYLTYNEGLCVQCMHLGSFDDEPATVHLMEEVAKKTGYEIDITDQRYHHEIYLGDPRKGSVTNRKTIIRHPVRRS